MQNRKDSLILKQKGNYIPLLKHGESVQVNEERDIVVRELQNREASQRISLEQFPKKNYKNRKSIQKKEPTIARAYQKRGFLICGLIRKINIP